MRRDPLEITGAGYSRLYIRHLQGLAPPSPISAPLSASRAFRPPAQYTAMGGLGIICGCRGADRLCDQGSRGCARQSVNGLFAATAWSRARNHEPKTQVWGRSARPPAGDVFLADVMVRCRPHPAFLSVAFSVRPVQRQGPGMTIRSRESAQEASRFPLSFSA